VLKAIAAGGFGVIHRAKHPRYGTVAYKELNSSFIPDASKLVYHYSSYYYWFIIILVVAIYRAYSLWLAAQFRLLLY